MNKSKNSSNMANSLIMQSLNRASTPISTLPQELEPQVRQPLSPMEILGQGLGIEQGLRGAGLDVTDANPIFGQGAPQEYRDKYFDMAYGNAMDQGKVDLYRRGIYDPGTTAGAAYLGNIESTGRKESFFAGEDYRNSLINQLLQRRESFFGNSARIPQEQNSLGISRDLGVEQQRGSRLGMLNDINQNASQRLFQAGQLQQQTGAARSANRTSALVGGLGLGAAALTSPLSKLIPGGSLLSAGIGGISSLFNRNNKQGGLGGGQINFGNNWI